MGKRPKPVWSAKRYNRPPPGVYVDPEPGEDKRTTEALDRLAPAVMYGILDQSDVDELLRRRAMWEARKVAKKSKKIPRPGRKPL